MLIQSKTSSAVVQSYYIGANPSIIIYQLMEKTPSKQRECQKPYWDWKHIQCNLKTIDSNRKSTVWNLTPRVILTNPANAQVGPVVRLYVDTQKSLQYSHELGWNWHKSWNIPNISLRLEIKDQSTSNILIPPPNLYVKLFAVKVNSENDKSEHMTLVDVGMRGVNRMEMIDGQVYFSAIKFSSTTYNNEGVNFHLLIVVYIQDEGEAKPKILSSVLSPSIFVDSRRSARDYQEKKFNSFVEPFICEALEKQFTKRQNKSRGEKQITIKNSPQGFYNYITAPNIRHKVKHLIFLAIKFSNCVKLYYNTDIIITTGTKKLLEDLQRGLLKQNKIRQKIDGFSSPNLNQKHFILAISDLQDSLKCKKVVQAIEIVQNDFIGITCSVEDLKEQFRLVGDEEQLRQSYKECYRSLMNICETYEPEDQSGGHKELGSQYQQQSSPCGKKHKIHHNEGSIFKKKPVGSNKKQKRSIGSNMSDANSSSQRIEPLLKSEDMYDSQLEDHMPYQNVHQNKLRRTMSTPCKPPFIPYPPVESSRNPHNLMNIHQNLVKIDQGPPFDPHIKSEYGFNDAQIVKQEEVYKHPEASYQVPYSHPVPNQKIKKTQITQSGLQNPAIQEQLRNLIAKDPACNNLAFSDWLGTVHCGDRYPYGPQFNYPQPDNLGQRFLPIKFRNTDIGRFPTPNSQQQSIINLIQQIAQYRQHLAQVAFQNQQLKREAELQQRNSAFLIRNNGYQSRNFNGYMNTNPLGRNMNNLYEMEYLQNMRNMYAPPRQELSKPNYMHNNTTINQPKEPASNPVGQYGSADNMKKGKQQNKHKNAENQLANPAAKNQSRGIPSNYEFIKNMIIQEIRKEAELKERANPKCQ